MERVTGRPPLLARWLLVVVVAAGVVAMHSLLGPGGCDGHGAGMGGVPASSGAAVMAEHPVAGLPAPPGLAAGDEAHAGHGPLIDPAGWTHRCGLLGHLCLAVLVALGLALLSVLPRALAGAGSDVNEARARGGATSPRAPPPTSVRLAELCVSRR